MPVALSSGLPTVRKNAIVEIARTKGAPLSNGTLTGHSIKMVGLAADHTYVTSSEGHVWSCFGRGHGGKQICSGIGNIDQADCLSKPDSKAGIVYAVTGVCHQAANRILYPSGKTVSAARGYRWSVFAYGTYGKDPLTGTSYSPAVHPWPELIACNGQSHR